MGTNFYLHKNVCEHCGRGDEELHIGKSSAGWCFSLRVHPELGINDLEDWEREWQGGVIKDEYGERLTALEMRSHIAERGRDKEWESEWWKMGNFYSSEAHFHQRNNSERGPNGLLRHRLGDHCIKHGAGTWDCIPGEFC